MNLPSRAICLLIGTILILSNLLAFAELPSAGTKTPLFENGVRLTRSADGRVLHAALPAWPKGNSGVLIRALSAVEQPRLRVVDVRLTGCSNSLHWVRSSEGLEIALPHERPADHPPQLQISLRRVPNSLPHSNRLHHIQRVPGSEPYPVPEYRWASDEAYEAFLDMKYGVRICWGVYSKLGVEASWPLLHMDNKRRQAYQELYKSFNPKDFDADRWMRFFKKNHMQMFAFITKHHDGFSMFDTKTRVKQRVNWTAKGGPKIEPCDLAYSITESPYKKDIVKQLCDAAREHRIKINLYYSHPDWYDANFRSGVDNPAKRLGKPSAAEVRQMMLRHRNQLKELTRNYGKIDMVCLDMTLPHEVWPELRQTMIELRAIQPDVMFRCRGIGTYGDYHTPEGWVPGDVEKNNMPWFVIYPLAHAFAYDPSPGHYRGGDWITYNVIDATSKGGNFMVSYGPDEHGRFHPKAIEATETTGRWLDVNAEAIFATRPWKVFGEGPTAERKISARGGLRVKWKSPYSSKDVRFTRSKDRKTIYAILMGWPGDGAKVTIRSIGSGLKINQVSLLGHSGELAWAQSGSGMTVTMPDEKPCDYAYALKIRLKDSSSSQERK